MSVKAAMVFGTTIVPRVPAMENILTERNAKVIIRERFIEKLSFFKAVAVIV